MKQKILYILLISLLIINSLLLFLLIKKPHEKREGPKRDFIAIELKFDQNQKEEFKNLDGIHRRFMRSLDEKIKEHKEILFHSFGNDIFNLDSITKEIGKLEAEKERTLFTFFSQVRVLCSASQKENFDAIIEKALKGGEKRPPREGNGHPPKAR